MKICVKIREGANNDVMWTRCIVFIYEARYVTCESTLFLIYLNISIIRFMRNVHVYTCTGTLYVNVLIKEIPIYLL